MIRRLLPTIFSCVILLVALCRVVESQDLTSSLDGKPSGVRTPDWGIQDASILAMNAWDFQKIDETQTWGFTPGTYRYRTSAAASNVLAGFHLPSGAFVTGMAIEACDTSVTGAAGLVLGRCDAGSDSAIGCSAPGVLSTGNVAAPGCGVYFLDLTAQNIVIDNVANTYVVSAATGTMDTTTSFRGVRLYYRLQVSPAPIVARFADVPTGHFFFQFIEALAASGITLGCDVGPPLIYCPDANVTRAEMAAFFARALGLHWAP